MMLEPGQAMLIKAGSILTFQVHYTANGTPANDQSSIGFIFAKEPPRQEVHSSAFVNATFAIPPGASDYLVDSAIEFNQPARILALFPHTHLRGRSWEYRLIYPDGRSEIVLAVPKYDFNWQTYYQFAKPLSVPKGARLEASAKYDNSAANKSNPDPNIEVHWGEQTWEEMQYPASPSSSTSPAARRTNRSQRALPHAAARARPAAIPAHRRALGRAKNPFYQFSIKPPVGVKTRRLPLLRCGTCPYNSRARVVVARHRLIPQTYDQIAAHNGAVRHHAAADADQVRCRRSGQRRRGDRLPDPDPGTRFRRLD